MGQLVSWFKAALFYRDPDFLFKGNLESKVKCLSGFGPMPGQVHHFLALDDSKTWKVGGQKDNEEANTEAITTMTSRTAELFKR